ncbi:ABC transporter permease [Pseudooceanicola sp. CBS1P-1]|uniref:ABC transporter permease subunit n=1 Tax=Pseudooceanicola albus TaxID=2692189 RepID=A0A6L7G819_9RHOB|nr:MULTISPECIES: ABC transporter permease [Pseudooceanicola]MBT9385308.1 ABC transporter permease [Pseudooceanicola endophyticus]MXN18833.1 ABC transporter permease subunit [Pseudooceanicola albus]
MPPALRAVLGKLITTLIVLFGVSILIFCIARIIPGDPVRIALGPNASQDMVDALRAQMHLDAPLVTQYVYFLRDVLHGDFGMSLYSKRPVIADIAQFLPATLELMIVAGIIMVGVGLPMGILAARTRDRWPDHLVRVITLLGVSAPGFVWAVVLMLIFAYFVPIFPIAGRISNSFQIPQVTGFMLVDTLLAGNLAAFADAFRHIILPACALAVTGIGQSARLTRANMVETYRKPYAEMAQSYGFPAGRIARRYVFKPSLIPSLTVIGLDFASMLGGAFLVESVFAWPGLSRYGVNVILVKDLNGIVGTVLVIAATFLIMNIIVDLLVWWLNPRFRLGGRS